MHNYSYRVSQKIDNYANNVAEFAGTAIILRNNKNMRIIKLGQNWRGIYKHINLLVNDGEKIILAAILMHRKNVGESYQEQDSN